MVLSSGKITHMHINSFVKPHLLSSALHSLDPLLYVSEYRKRDLMAQKLFFELLIPSYSMIFEL